MNTKSPTYKVLQEIKKWLTKPAIWYIIIGVILLLFMNFLPGSKQIGLYKTLVFYVAGLGFTLLLGYAGLASLGTAGFMAIGAYSFGILFDRGVPLTVVILIVIAISILLGIAVGFISLRVEGIFLAIVTLGLSEIIVEVLKIISKSIGNMAGYHLEKYQMANNLTLLGEPFKQFNDKIILIAIIITVIGMILVNNIIKSSTGRAMLSLKNSQPAGQSMGMNLLYYRLLAFVISLIFAAIAGILFMGYFQITEPVTDWTLNNSLLILAAAVIGGAKSIIGVLFGSLFVFGLNLLVLQDILFFRNNSNVTVMFTGILIILIVMYYPGGFYQLYLSAKFKIQKRIYELKQNRGVRKEEVYGKNECYQPFTQLH